MPVGAIIGGVATLGGALLGSKSQSKAAQTASDTSLQVAQQNNALAKDIYGQNKATLAPFVAGGTAAGSQINALLGLGGPQQATQQQSYAPQQQQAYAPQQSYNTTQPTELHKQFQDWGFGTADYADVGQWDGLINEFGGSGAAYAPGGSVSAGGQVNYTVPTTQPNSQQNAFDVFRNSTGYQFRLGEGMNALNSGYAGAGVLQSGAAMRDAVEYGQNFASNEFGNYMGYLGNQQGVGLAAASAQAGVGNNYVSNVSANNNAAGTAAANAALAQGASNPWANALGTIGGGLLSGGIKF